MNSMITVGADRVISFDSTLREKRQQVYDINNYETVDFCFEKAGQKKVYKNFNLSIFVDDYCNADCKFCVAQLRYAHRQQAYNKPKIADTETYFKRLTYVLEKIRPLNPSVSITGGEPTLSPNLIPILKIVDDLGFRKRTITTNGSGLFNTYDGKPILNHLIDLNINHLNISRTSIDDELNQKIMRYTNPKENYCSNAMIEKILKVIKGSPLHHRISCLLLKESVCSVQKIKEFVDFYSNYGADNFIFRELMDYSQDAINKEKIAYCDRNKIKLNDIWKDFESVPEFVPYLNILGYYYYVEIYKYNECTLASESANLNQQYIEKSKHQDTIYEMVFHPNGNLCGSWVDSEDILL